LWRKSLRTLSIQQTGTVTAELSYRGENVGKDFDLSREDFEELCEKFAVEADYEITDVRESAGKAYVEVTLKTVDVKQAYDFLKDLEYVGVQR